jgi:beta-glucosidase
MADVSDLHVDLVAASFSLNLSAHARQLRRNFMNTTPIEELLDEHEAHGITPQFAFGHGLSYQHRRARLAGTRPVYAAARREADCHMTVCNTGTCAGSEMVQLYVHDEASSLIRPPQELKAFAKVTLQPGQAQTVSLTLGMRAFAAYDDVRRAWVAEAGRFELRVGASSADISQRPIRLS